MNLFESNSTEDGQSKSAKLAATEVYKNNEIEDFKVCIPFRVLGSSYYKIQEYLSEEESEDEVEEEAEISENEDDRFDITFKLPDYLSRKPETAAKEDNKKLTEQNDFFINVAQEDNSENEADSGNDESSELESGDTPSNGFFIEDGKTVKLKSNQKLEDAKRKVNKDNRQGQRERKKHAKAVYGKHVEGKSVF